MTGGQDFGRRKASLSRVMNSDYPPKSFILRGKPPDFWPSGGVGMQVEQRDSNPSWKTVSVMDVISENVLSVTSMLITTSSSTKRVMFAGSVRSVVDGARISFSLPQIHFLREPPDFAWRWVGFGV